MKRLIFCLLAIGLISGLISQTTTPVQAADTITRLTNVVVFVDFNDTDHSSHSFLFGECSQKDPAAAVALFEGDSPRSLAPFLDTISYGQLQVNNIFPQYDKETNRVRAYQLSNNAESYYSSNLLSTGSTIIQEILPELRKDLSGQDIDLDQDGALDNLTLIVPSDNNSRDSLFYSHQGVYGGTDTINGAGISNYNVLTEYSLTHSGSAVVIHEFLHTRGYPDLYDATKSSSSGDTGETGSTTVTHSPVWLWDIMSSAYLYPRYPLAYLRGEISGWFDIPTLSTSQTGCTLYSASDATTETKDQQAVILKTPYSDTEFFVLEYRKKGNSYNETDYDCGLPGSGLIVYRVDMTLRSVGNYSGAPYMIYVFRPGDRMVNGHEQGGGLVAEAYLSAQSLRTSYGSANPEDSLADGAITYSDGANSGIVISNVGEAGGTTITFDVAFPAEPENAWKTETVDSVDENPCLSGYQTEDGAMYYLLRKSGGVSLYRYTSSGLSVCTDPLPSSGNGFGYKLARYNDDFYAVGYQDGCARIWKQNGSDWQTVYTSPVKISEMSVTDDDQGIYLAYTTADGQNLSVIQYAENTVTLGAYAAQAKDNTRITAPEIAAENGTAAVMYCDFPTDFQSRLNLVVRAWDTASNTWHTVGTPIPNANGIRLKIHNGAIYLLKGNADGTAGDGAFLYHHDFSADGDWEPLSGAYAAGTVSAADLSFSGDTPIILCCSTVPGQKSLLRAVTLSKENNWLQIGEALSQSAVSDLYLTGNSDHLYAAYLTDVSRQFYLKSYQTAADHTHQFQTRLTQPATCGQTGLYTHTCTICGVSQTEVIPMLSDHTFGSWIVSVSPTCTAAGSQTRVCTVCGRKETKTLPPTGHRWASAFTVDVEPAYAHTGRKSIHCTACNALKEETVLPAKPNPFVDITFSGNQYYDTPVLWALDHAITAGTDPTHFSPLDVCTRAQVVTFLWRAAACPEPKNQRSAFTDVQNPSAFYYKAVLWAGENHITAGTDATHFTPDATVTRGQFVTFLWRFAQKPDHNGENPFTDIAPGVNSFYYDAVLWACEQNITKGVEENRFAPSAPCQRGQTVTFLYRYFS